LMFLPDEQASALQEICFNHLPTLTLWTGIDVPEEGDTEAEKKMTFAEADSSLLLKHWVDLEPNELFGVALDSAIKSQYFPDLMETHRFEPVRPDFGRYGQGSAAHGTVPSKDTKNGRDTTRKHGQKNNAFSSESKTLWQFVITLNSNVRHLRVHLTSGTLGGNKSSGSKPGKRAEYCFDFFETGSRSMVRIGTKTSPTTSVVTAGSGNDVPEDDHFNSATLFGLMIVNLRLIGFGSSADLICANINVVEGKLRPNASSPSLRLESAVRCRDWDKLDEVIEGTLSAEWTKGPSAEGFLMRLRKLDDKEARDHPDQKYCCEMASMIMVMIYIGNVPEVQRQQYDQAVSQFCEDHGREEVDEITSSTSSTVEGDVYEKTSSFTRRDLYSASYGGRTTTDLLTGLRVNFCGPDRLSSTRNDGPSDSTLKLGFDWLLLALDNDETNKSRSCDGMDFTLYLYIMHILLFLFYDDIQICSSVNEAAKIIPILSAIDSADEIARVKMLSEWELCLGVLLRVHCGALQMHCICKSPEKRRFVEPIGKWKVPLQFIAAEVKLMNRIVGCLQQDSEASSDCVHSSIGYGYVITTLKGIKLRAVAMPWNPRIHALVAADAVVRSDIYKRIKKGVKGMERLAVRRLVATVRDILLDWQDTLKIDFLTPLALGWGRIPTAGYCSIKSSNRSLLNRFEVVQKDDCEYVLVKLKIGWRVYVPADIGEYELRDRLLQLAHDAVGHLVPLQMKNRLSRWVYWPGMLSDCEAFTRHCLGCDRERARHTPGPVSGWTYTDPSSGTVLHGCSVLLMVDGCSNYTELAVASDQTVPTVVRLLLDRWVLRYGVPLIVRSDRGHSFCSKVLRLLYAKLQISFVPSSGITPQSQGQIEVIVRALKRHLERLLTSDLSVIPLVQRVINTTIRYVTSGSETVFTPELMLYGESTKGSLEVMLDTDTFRYHDDLHASDDPVAITDRVRNAVNTFTEGWCSEVAERRAKSVDALNQRRIEYAADSTRSTSSVV
ncbi:hypothetical protein FOZ60_016916, partial [Perkinsus olseni]